LSTESEWVLYFFTISSTVDDCTTSGFSALPGICRTDFRLPRLFFGFGILAEEEDSSKLVGILFASDIF
jgi:hypothetical protein